MDIPSVSVKELHTRLGFDEPLDYPETSLNKPLIAWKMEIDDSPIFRYIYRHFQPRRHLEFGTWQGTGVTYCLEECEATVWTINLLRGEELLDGSWAYSNNIVVQTEAEKNNLLLPIWSKGKWTGNSYGYQTDSLGFIGRYYLERDMGYRVCQIYCDSREWDISNYPEGFFDTVLIDGGHTEEIVASDTRKACQLLRSGGLIVWHDFCPDPEVQKNCAAPRGVLSAIKNNWDWIQAQMADIFWIEPSWILVGVKKSQENIQWPSLIDEGTELKRLQSRWQHTQLKLERSQAQLHQTQAKWERSQAQLHQTQAKWERSQAQLQQTQLRQEQLQAQLQQTQLRQEQLQAQLQQTQLRQEQLQTQLEQSQAQLHQTQAQLEQSQAQLHQTRAEWEQSQALIAAMESSKFWKLRTAWIQVKKTMRLPTDD